jgi:ABC-type phosphate transport system permease subunit
LGIEVSFLRLQWHTTALNRVFQQWSKWKPQLQAAWFSVGVIVSLMLMPMAAFLMLRGLLGSVSEEYNEKSTGFKLEPVVK